MGLSVECDVVEFRKDAEQGISLHGKDGCCTVYLVEYKRVAPKENPCDILQLTAQAICLEEMLCCTISEGALYYFETHHRAKISITDELRDAVCKYAVEMYEYYDRQCICRAPNVPKHAMPVL